MWNSSKSLRLSCVCTRLFMVLVGACAATLPYLIECIVPNGLSGNVPHLEKMRAMAGLYACAVLALLALFRLDRLLTNIKEEKVFINRNVAHLRAISWCCFGASVLLALIGYYFFFFYFIAIFTAFIGLILRVVKNVIEQAIILKTENDFTI